jgi:hypothetical protein
VTGEQEWLVERMLEHRRIVLSGGLVDTATTGR